MLKTITLVLALDTTGLAIGSVTASAAPNFVNHTNSQSQAYTACTDGNAASYCN